MEELRMGARIARYRKENGLTQEALANRLGVTNQAVSKWEGDVCCPDIQLLPELETEEFDIPVDTVLWA